MSENNLRPGGEEEALSDLIASAIKNKKTVPSAGNSRTSTNIGTELSDRIAQAKHNKENGIKARPKPQPQPTAAEPEEGELSIEQMVANAMSMKAKGGRAQVQQTSAIYYDEHIEAADDPEIDDWSVNADGEGVLEGEEGSNNFIQKFKAFCIKHKLELMMAGLVLVVIAIIALIAFIVLFNHYYDRIGRGSNNIILESINDIGEDDTVSDVEGYENFLKDQLKPYGDIMTDEGVYNILLIGEDLRDTSAGSRGNTDVMMLVSINSETKRITLSSFMRDIYLYIPGYYSTRLNAAYATGGAELLKDTIEQNFGIKIDNYVIVNFYTFIDIIDTIGGVDVEITDNMIYAMKGPLREQNKYLGNSRDQDMITTAGAHHLNGNQALSYVRIRKGVGDDYARTARQREIIAKMIDKSKGMSLFEMKQLLDKITEGDNIKWDLEKSEVLSLLTNAFDYYKNYEVQQLQIPANGTFSGQRIRGMDVLCPDFAANTELLQMTIYGKTFIDPSLTITWALPPTTTPKPYVVSSTTTTTTPTQTTTVPTETTTWQPDEPDTTTEPTSPPDVTTTPDAVTTPEVTTPPTETTTPAQKPPSETAANNAA